jgi:hypothetical protein
MCYLIWKKMIIIFRALRDFEDIRKINVSWFVFVFKFVFYCRLLWMAELVSCVVFLSDQSKNL